MKANQKRSSVLSGFALLATVLLLLPAMASEKVPDASAQQFNKILQTTVMIVGTGQNTQFYPPSLNINIGSAVMFINQDGTAGGIAHSVLSTDSASGLANDAFDSGLIKVGQSYKVTFDKAGIYTYIDPTYPNAVGQIIVTP